MSRGDDQTVNVRVSVCICVDVRLVGYGCVAAARSTRTAF